MATFRVEKNNGYTVMSNYHLRDKNLSLKAKGLLSYMLSLPEDWDYTLSGLSVNCKDKIDSVRSGIKELEDNKYLKRIRTHGEDGRFGSNEYFVYEKPYEDENDVQNERDSSQQMNHEYKNLSDVVSDDSSNDKTNKNNEAVISSSQPSLENPIMEENSSLLPSLENPTLENPSLENPTQININILNTNITKDKIDKIDIRARKDIIKQQIDYETLWHSCDALQKDILDELIEIITETIVSEAEHIRINGINMPIQLVRERLNSLNYSHLEYVLNCFTKTTTEVKNIKKYMFAALFNAPVTIDSYYTNQVKHDMSVS